ncbi:MAG: AbrB/MazE/SpoVT family DNA-binding domain-containing protein [Clostridiales bacterium]|nr:AbrB/MazE/SpoVT family DNA-binding domain-containing protein [Clostridiales bacterium]
MVASGFVRKIDELGRIVLPMELRKSLQIEEKDSFEIFVDEGRIVLQKYEQGDLFTGELNNLVEYKGKKFSKATIVELASLVGLIKK